MAQTPRKFPNHTYCIRVARGKGELPYNVQIVMPRADGLPDTSPRDPRKAYIEDVMPDTVDHHLVLGQFLHHWNGVEFAICQLLSGILSKNEASLLPITNHMGVKQIINAINSVATIKLNDDGIGRLYNIMERVSKLNSKRNILVHGFWTLEIIIFPSKGGVVAKVQLLREVAPNDKRLEAMISDLRNQKERVRHTFTTKRIIGATFDAINLINDMRKFGLSIDSYRISESST